MFRADIFEANKLCACGRKGLKTGPSCALPLDTSIICPVCLRSLLGISVSQASDGWD